MTLSPPIPSSDWLWWLALVLQLLAIPGTLLPVLPGLVLLPVGAGVWCWAVGWESGWPTLVLALVLLLLGWGAEALGLLLGPSRLKASRWAYGGAALGLLAGLFGLLPALPIGGPLLGALIGPWLGSALGELVAGLLDHSGSQATLPLLRRSGLVGLAVVAGMLVSRVAQAVLALVGVVGFVILSR